MDAADIVAGKARYLNDIKMADMLYGKVLRSPHPHAYIRSIDKTRAQALRGIKAILTWKDVPDWRGGTPRYTRVLDRKVRFVGDAVALVAATSEQKAIDALRLIDVEYEILPAVLTAEDALREGAPQLYEEFPGNIVTPGMPFFGPKNLKEVVMGDVDKGFEEADAITEGTFGYENMPNPLLTYWFKEHKFDAVVSVLSGLPYRMEPDFFTNSQFNSKHSNPGNWNVGEFASATFDEIGAKQLEIYETFYRYQI